MEQNGECRNISAKGNSVEKGQYFFKLTFIGLQLLCRVLVSSVQQNESATGIHIPLPFWTYSDHHRAFYFILSINSGYVSIPKSQLLPPPFSLDIQNLFSMSMPLVLLCIKDHLCHFSRFYIYSLKYNICFSLCDLLHST